MLETINGGAGAENTLDYSAFRGPVTVNLTDGTATALEAGGRFVQPVEDLTIDETVDVLGDRGVHVRHVAS